MSTPEKVFGSFDNFEKVSKGLAQSMIAQHIAGVNGAIPPQKALEIGNVVRTHWLMLDVATQSFNIAQKWLRRSVLLNIGLFIALIIAIVV